MRLNLIKLLSISGSPVADSSTDFLLNHIAEQIDANLKDSVDIETEFIKLQNHSIKPCEACGFDPSPKFCIHDDINYIYDKLIHADCLLFGSPIYFDSVSAQAKLLIDRCNCFRPPYYQDTDSEHLFRKRLPKKRPGAMVLVGGEETWFEGARRVVAGFFKWIEISNEGLVSYGSPDYNKKGTVSDHPDVIQEADNIAKKLSDILKDTHDKSK